MKGLNTEFLPKLEVSTVSRQGMNATRVIGGIAVAAVIHPALGIHLLLALIAVELPRVVHGRVERQWQHVLVQVAPVV